MSILRPSDERLVRRASAGDQDAFAAIFARYQQEIYRYCRALLADPDEAQDALQNTMTKVLRALPGERRTLALRPWLYRIARNESISLIRARERSDEFTEELAPLQPAADLTAERREAVRTLVRDLASLPERQRSALVMRELSGLSHEEVATALQVSPQVARQTVYEARIALQELEEGRRMECERVREAISDRDRRVLRGRRIRAHMRTCRGCSDFALAIETRREGFELMAPPLPAAAATGLIAAVLGAAGKGGGAVGGLAASAGAASAGPIGLKSLGVVAASAVLGVGAASIGGVDLPFGAGDDSSRPGAEARQPAPAGGAEPATEAESRLRAPADTHASGDARPAAGTTKPPRRKPAEAGSSGDHGKGAAASNSGGGSEPAGGTSGQGSGGASATAPAGGGKPLTPPGSAVAAGKSGERVSEPTTGPPAQANAGGVAPPRAKSDE